MLSALLDRISFTAAEGCYRRYDGQRGARFNQIV